MVEIETVDLTGMGIELPHGKVGFVIAQPHVRLTETEPFRWAAGDIASQIAVVNRTLEVALLNSHGAAKTHFTIFPEYSIPGLVGFQTILERLATPSWPNQTLVVCGLDGLSKFDYLAMSVTPNIHFHPSSSPAVVPDTSWVNCVAVCVKASDGSVHVWIQPKLAPAAEEAGTTTGAIFPGKSIFVFKGPLSNGTYYRFATLICFDWIATIEAKRSFEWMLESINNAAGEGSYPLTWVFVVQNNKKPSDFNFLSRVAPFFEPVTFPKVDRVNAGLVFANTAGAASPKRVTEYGGTSVVFCPVAPFTRKANRPTVCDGGSKFRDGSQALNGYKDALFRERGACIHSFSQIHPNSFGYGPANRTFSIDDAYVYSIDGNTDPRAPGAPVPAGVKWINDELDGIQSVSSTFPNAALSMEKGLVHAQNVALIRMSSGQQVERIMELSTPGLVPHEPDNWDAKATNGLQHFVNCLDILSSRDADPATLVDGSQALFTLDGLRLRLIAVLAQQHEDCIQHAAEHSRASTAFPTLLVSRDQENTAWDNRSGSYIRRAAPTAHESGEIQITDPEAAISHIGYEKLLRLFRSAGTEIELLEQLKAEIHA